MLDERFAISANAGISPAQNTVTAIDIVLEPDAIMIEHAQATNAGLLKNFPKGFALGDEHARTRRSGVESSWHADCLSLPEKATDPERKTR